MGYESGMSLDAPPTTTFTRMTDAAAEDYALILRNSLGFMQGLPDRILRHLMLLGGDTGGYAVDRLTHSLQTANSDVPRPCRWTRVAVRRSPPACWRAVVRYALLCPECWRTSRWSMASAG
jgi:hypothetical protein